MENIKEWFISELSERLKPLNFLDADQRELFEYYESLWEKDNFLDEDDFKEQLFNLCEKYIIERS